MTKTGCSKLIKIIHNKLSNPIPKYYSMVNIMLKHDVLWANKIFKLVEQCKVICFQKQVYSTPILFLPKLELTTAHNMYVQTLALCMYVHNSLYVCSYKEQNFYITSAFWKNSGQCCVNMSRNKARLQFTGHSCLLLRESGSLLMEAAAPQYNQI